MSDSRTAVKNVMGVLKSAKAEAAVSARATGPAPEELHQTIAILAYQYAERRNFEPGHEMEDWLNAESEVLAEKKSLKASPA